MKTGFSHHFAFHFQLKHPHQEYKNSSYSFYVIYDKQEVFIDAA